MSNQGDFVGRIRDNWRQRAGESTTLRADLRLIPRWVLWLLAAAYVVALAALFHFDLAGASLAGMTLRQVAEKELVEFGLVTAIAIPVSAFVILIVYIGADAKRRGMSPVLWELVALLVPYLIGAILYFVVREPLPFDCPHCGRKVNAHFNFCPGCQFNLRANCPQCRRAIHPGDRFCPHCGFGLTSEVPTPDGTQKA
ncbi:MAG: zinc ribbon domain-containing protein [Acidobacteria bacterium]|nr:zinc ribbon domain-containing protein [Acidobacteriota bacterium]